MYRKCRDSVLMMATVTMLFYGGCQSHPNNVAVQEQEAMQQTAASEGTHIDNAAGAVGQAQRVATNIPAAAPVLPPLKTASAELTAAHTDNGTLRGQLTHSQSTVQTITDKLTAAEAKVSDLTKQVAAWAAKWSAAWLGGRSWFWIHVIEGVMGALFLLAFVGEFFLEWPIHPLSWVILAAPYIAKFLIRIVKGIYGEVTTIGANLLGLVSKLRTPTTTAKPTSPSVVGVSTNAVTTGVAFGPNAHQG